MTLPKTIEKKPPNNDFQGKPRRLYASSPIRTLMFGNFLLIGLFGCLVSNAAIGTTPNPNPSLVEREFIAARESFERRDVAALRVAREKFASRSGFPLSPYVTWWWLSAQLGQGAQNARVLGEEIESFITANPNAPFTEQLQRDYLRALGKLDLWTPFALNQSKYRGEDNEVACQRLRYRIQNDDRNVIPVVLRDVKTLWVIAKPATDPCYELFSRLTQSNLLSTEEIWQRTRALFENGQMSDARRTAAFVPGIASNFEAMSAQANLDPNRFLSKHIIKAGDRASTELTLFAVTRLARSNAESAANWLEKNDARLSKIDAQYAWAQVGHWGALQLDSRALDWFGRAGQYDFSDAQAAWLVRAALRETATDPSQWATVKRAILTMSETERREAAWRYWLARALVESKNPADLMQAKSLRETLSRERHFYGVMAAEEIGTPMVPNFNGHQPTDIELADVANRSGIQRAFALYRLAEFKSEFRLDGLREWQFAIRGMDDQTLLAAAEAALRRDLPDQAINTAERTQSLHDFGQRYPLPHRESLQSSAKQNGLDESWVFGLIRQESRFIADARSRVGAIGLMQLMPATAKWVGKQIGMPALPMTKVTDIPTNLALGSFYLRHVLDDVGHPVLATAGYNAGPGRARRWRAATPLEGAIYAESIPFNETRDYVKKVMVNKWFYNHRIYGKSPTLSAIMGIVPSKSSTRAAMTAVADTTASAALSSSTQQP